MSGIVALRFGLLLTVFLTALSGVAPNAAWAICTPIAQKTPGNATITLANWSGAAPLFRPAYQDAALSDALPKPGSIEITYLGHSSFLLRTAGGVSAITDYNDGIAMPLVPTVATMNQAHITHFSIAPDPGIEHVLRGWSEAGEGIAQHALTVGDLDVRNIPTNIRSYEGTVMGGNSIFVFETAGLCIAHLGHLHHTLTRTHLAALGIIDVLMVPVDGSFTLDQDLMAEVVKQINPSVVIPMHVFSDHTLSAFLGYLEGRYTVKPAANPTVILSRATLPFRTVLVLPGY